MPTDKILLVESEPRILELLVDSFVRRFESNITCVSSGADALDVEVLEPHSIAVIDTEIKGMPATVLAQRLREYSDRPVILIGKVPSTEMALEALRSGVMDYFVKPFEVCLLLDAMEAAVATHRERRRHRVRYERMRRLVRRVIRDRRVLNRRVELICKDLVGAHRRLVRRVVEKQPADV